MEKITIKDKKALSELRIKYQQWSGFEFEADTLDEALERINNMKYKLECEISDYARHLDAIAKKAFNED